MDAATKFSQHPVLCVGGHRPPAGRQHIAPPPGHCCDCVQAPVQTPQPGPGRNCAGLQEGPTAAVLTWRHLVGVLVDCHSLLFLLLIFLILPDIVYFLHLPCQDLHHKQNDILQRERERERQKEKETERERRKQARVSAGRSHRLTPAAHTAGQLMMSSNDVSPEGVGEGDQGQGDDVVHHHDDGVSPPDVHVDRGIDGVAIEASLNQICHRDVCRNHHPALPTYRQGMMHGSGSLCTRSATPLPKTNSTTACLVVR
ncbi:hypothetical protein JZ751_015509 [Albula glossodonta]|uniref:Uncharacterized protein n=1 Tax=Albula glossodonta TaxID=121402 RepID=A0A8T2N302_9TELE|nr:hypothetical protein JZ751_015509 [Albula glossodonta]